MLHVVSWIELHVSDGQWNFNSSFYLEDKDYKYLHLGVIQRIICFNHCCYGCCCCCCCCYCCCCCCCCCCWWWWWWWWWLWWIFFVVWLTDKKRLALFPAGTIVFTIVNLQHAANRICSCAEPEFRFWWIKLRSSDNHYTTEPLTLTIESKFV